MDQKKKVAQGGLILTDVQLVASEKAKETILAQGEIESHHPGYLRSQDTYYVGKIKGIGRIYQQTYRHRKPRRSFTEPKTQSRRLICSMIAVLLLYKEFEIKLFTHNDQPGYRI